MSAYKIFAVAGAGHIGKPIMEELAKLKAAGIISILKVLTRSADSRPDIVAVGAEPVTVDFSSISSLSSALKGVEVVVSTLGSGGIQHQPTLAVAAKEAGVRLFLPSEFGPVTLGATDGFYGRKEALRHQLKELGVPFACFFCGPWTDMVFFVRWFGIDLAGGKATIGPNGDHAASYTTIPDAARFVAHVLTSVPASKLENSVWRFEGDRISLNEVFAGFEARTGKKINVTYIPKQVLEAKIKANPNDLISIAHLRLSEGKSVVGTPEEVSNSIWTEWNPQKVLDVICP